MRKSRYNPEGKKVRLKRCPFCGGEAKATSNESKTLHRIWCSTCGAIVEWYGTKEETVTAWNRREGGK